MKRHQRLRFVSYALTVVGLVHLLFPGVLLQTARSGYDSVLAVDFEPRARATRRVRLVGVGCVAVGVTLRRLARWVRTGG